MQARLADGRILNFPDGTDPSVVDATVKKVIANPLSAYTEEELKKVPTASTSTADFLRQVGQGGISGAKSLTDLFGAGNDSLSKANEYLGKNISPELQQEQRINQELQERAKNKGWFDELSASLRPALQHPFTSMASGIVSSVPLIAGAALAEPLGLGTAAAGGIGALMGLGGQKGQNYQAVHDEAIRKGKSEAEAEALGQQAAEYSLKNTPSLALGAGLGALEGEFAAPAKLGRFLNPAKLESGAIQNLAKPSFAKALGQSSLEGGGTEFLQGAGAQVGSNLALQNAGFDTPLFEGSLGQGAHDALIGALTGAAVSPAQLSSLKREYDADQAKVLTEQAAKKQKESADLITKFNEQNQIKPELLALPAPAQKIEGKQAEQSLQNPHGNYTAEELGPERVEAIDTHRADNGKPPLNSYSIEDIVDAMPSQSLHPADTRVKNPEGERADLNALIANKVGHTNEKVTPQDVVNKAIERNVDPSGEGFKDFLRRTTGIGELNMMTDGQRFAAQQALQNMEPHTGEAPLILPRGTNATHYDADQRLNAINALDQHGGPVSQEKAIETIKKATGLERDQDAQHMIAELVRSGDFDLNKDNELEQPSSTSYLPPGYHIEEGSFKEGEAPEHFKIMAADKELGTADTQEAAEEKKNKYLETRAKKSESIDKEIEQKQAALQKSKDDLEAMEAMGEGRTPAYQKASADHAALETNTQKEIGDLNRTKSELDPEVNPLSIKAGNIVPKTRKGFTIFKNNQSIGTFPDRSTAEKTIAANLTTKELEQLTGDKRRRSFARLADQELNDRVTTGIKVKVTKEFEQAAPELGKQLEAMLAKFGLKGVGLKLMSTLGGNEGEYAHSLIKIALDITDPVGVLRHESVHALKELGFFTENQWNALRRMAKDKWIQQYLKDKPFAEGKSRYDAYMEMYKGDMNAIEEEAIADAFRDFAKNGSPPGMIAALIKRLNEFFEAIKNVLSGNGFNTANDVFEKIENGELVSTKQGASETKASVKTAKWAEKEEAPDKFGREDALRRMYRKLNNAYTETDSPAEAYDLAYESSSPAEQRILRALKKDDFLGFDYPHQAIHEIIENPENYDISTPFKVALSVVGNKEGRASLKSPLEPYVSAQEAQERIQRRINRPAGVGSPTNQRIEFTNENGQKLVVGKITHEDWLNRVNTLMDKEEIKDSRNWYKQLHELFEPLFGAKSSDYALAWLLSQQRASPTKGLTDVLRASDIAQGKQKVMGAGLNEQALIDVLSGRIPKSGVGAKLLDFIDSELGLPARTYMKGDVRGRQPAAIDVWAQRDIGFVDPTIHEYIRKTFGEEAAKSVSVDKTVNGESQYEHGIDFYNDVVDMLNNKNYMGGGWTAREVQAVGWVTMQRALGIKAEFVRDIVNGNTRRISIGLAPGGGSVMAGKLMGKEIPVKSAQKVIDNLAKLAGIKVIQNVDGVGAYLTYVEGAIQIDAIASPESVADFMDMVGYAFQQTEIINTRALASGKNMAIDVMSNGLDTSDKAVKFFTEFLNHVPKKGGDPIAAGFQQITVDGKHGIRLLNFGGNWRQTQVKEIQDALNKTSILTDTRLNDVVVSQVVLSSTKNNWTEEHNGNTYLDSLRTRGRLQEAQQLQREYPPSRFDLTEDKGITWGGTRYSLGSTESTIRPSDRSDEGITLGQQQEGAVSYSGVHYGKEKTDVLKGSKYGTGLRGAERRRLEDHWDDRVKRRVYFYIPKATGEMPQRESGLGGHVYTQKFNNILGPGKEMSRLMIEARDNANEFESAIVDAGYDGYAVPNMGMMVILNHDVPVKYQGTVSEVNKASLKAPETPAFKRFFGDSKITDKNGEPMVMYHATNSDFNVFNRSDDGKLGEGIYSTSIPQYANEFAPKGNIMPLFVHAENPFLINVTRGDKAFNERFSGDINKAMVKAVADFTDGKTRLMDLEGNQVRELFEKNGYDGIVVKDDQGNIIEANVFTPNQLKSATGNKGTYDFNNPDVRASLGNLLSGIPNAAGLVDRLNTVTPGREDVGHARRMIEAIRPKNWGDVRTNFFNRYNQLAVHDKMLAKSKGLVKLMADSSAEAAALMSDLASGIAAEAMGKNGGVPVFKNGYTSIDRSTKGLVEIFAPLAKMNSPDAYRLYQFWAGSKRARRLIKEGREENYTAADMAHAKEIEKMYGHIFEPVHKEWIKYNNGLVKYLVDTGVLSPSKAAEFSKYSDYIPFYRQVDGDTTVGPQLFQSMTGVKAPKKLKGGEGPLADFLETVVRNTHAAIQSGTKNVAATRAVHNAAEIGLATKVPFKQDNFNTVKIFEKGQESYYQVADPLLINAMQGLNLPNLPFLGFFAAPANWLRNMVTKDPGFMLANMMKDSISAYITSGSNMTPVVDTVKHFTTAMAGTNPIIERLRAAGIGGGHLGGDIETAGRDLAKKLRKEAGTKTNLEKGLTPFTSLWEGLEHGTEASDLATRAAIYQKTMDETGNEAEAIYQALEVMNFYRKGANPLIRILSAVTPFLNARIQGLDVFYRTGFAPFFDENATEADKTKQKAFMVRGATLMALSAAYWALTHDDDDYKKQEQETRDNNWLIPSLGIKMPIPFEVGFLFKVIPERILEYSYGNDTGKDFMASMRRGITSTLAIQAPQILQPIIETQTNFSFFTGRAIVPQGLQNVAPEFQVGPSTTKTFEALGKEFGQSPIMLEHLWQGYTGTMGMYIVDAIDSIINSNSDTPKATKRFEQMPFIKRFALDPQARGSVSSYYDLKDSVDQAVRTANLLEKTNNFEDLSQYMQDNAGLLATDDYVKAMDKDMKDLQNQASMVRASSLSADDKRDVLKAIGEAQNALTANVQYLKKMMSQRQSYQRASLSFFGGLSPTCLNALLWTSCCLGLKPYGRHNKGPQSYSHVL